MTEKRFKEIYPDIIRSNYCFTDNGEPIGDKEVCDLLNEQHETIQRLKENIDELLSVNIEKELLKENEQLRNRINDWHQRTFKAHEYFNILEKVIDEVCDDDISNQIWKEYEKREKLVE